MKKITTVLSAVALCFSLSITNAFAGISSGSGAMAAAVNQANEAVDVVTSLMTNITTQFNATHEIQRAYPRIPRSSYVAQVYSSERGVITVRYRSSKIAGPLKDIILTFTPQHNGRALNPGSDVNIEDWTCTFKSSSRVNSTEQYKVVHNIFNYAQYPLNICYKR